MKYTSKSIHETKDIAQKFLDTLVLGDKATVVALYGNLGSGKTSFTQKVGEILGVRDNMNSPTFVIMKIYDLKHTTNNSQPTTDSGGQSSVVSRWSRLIHIDAYRLEKESELLNLGWEDITKDKENLIFIEWPENVKGLIPPDVRKIFFTFVDENIREIEYE